MSCPSDCENENSRRLNFNKISTTILHEYIIPATIFGASVATFPFLYSSFSNAILSKDVPPYRWIFLTTFVTCIVLITLKHAVNSIKAWIHGEPIPPFFPEDEVPLKRMDDGSNTGLEKSSNQLNKNNRPKRHHRNPIRTKKCTETDKNQNELRKRDHSRKSAVVRIPCPRFTPINLPLEKVITGQTQTFETHQNAQQGKGESIGYNLPEKDQIQVQNRKTFKIPIGSAASIVTGCGCSKNPDNFISNSATDLTRIRIECQAAKEESEKWHKIYRKKRNSDFYAKRRQVKVDPNNVCKNRCQCQLSDITGETSIDQTNDDKCLPPFHNTLAANGLTEWNFSSSGTHAPNLIYQNPETECDYEAHKTFDSYKQMQDYILKETKCPKQLKNRKCHDRCKCKNEYPSEYNYHKSRENRRKLHLKYTDLSRSPKRHQLEDIDDYCKVVSGNSSWKKDCCGRPRRGLVDETVVVLGRDNSMEHNNTKPDEDNEEGILHISKLHIF